jgi:DNA-binding protein HU-beta
MSRVFIPSREVTVNKSDLVGKVAETAKAGDRVAWPGFGSFSRTQRKARTGRNPRTGEAVKIPATKAVKFSPSSTLKDYMNSGAAKKAGGAKKAAAKKAGGAKKAAAKKAGAKKAAAKKAPARKAPSGRAPRKKAG